MFGVISLLLGALSLRMSSLFSRAADDYSDVTMEMVKTVDNFLGDPETDTIDQLIVELCSQLPGSYFEHCMSAADTHMAELGELFDAYQCNIREKCTSDAAAAEATGIKCFLCKTSMAVVRPALIAILGDYDAFRAKCKTPGFLPVLCSPPFDHIWRLYLSAEITNEEICEIARWC